VSVRSSRSALRVLRSALGRILFVTGSDTGVGKTVLTALLTRHLRATGVRVAALKPIGTGGRDDARVLHAALDGNLTLDEINPWHFRAPLAPLLAARQEGKRVRLAPVVTHARRVQKRCDLLLVEGAGGLLSPLGEGFSSRELVVALRATPVIVCPNRLGAVSQARLVLAALPPTFRRRAIVVLMGTRAASPASRFNRPLLVAHHPAGRVIEVPWVPGAARVSARVRPQIRRALSAVVRA
jgi:dethiobiotin synthetase